MFSDSALIFWGSACLIWDSALRAWHSHLSWAAKPEQEATSWAARGNSLPVLLPLRFFMTPLSWRSVQCVCPLAWSKPSVPQTAAEAPLLHFKAVQVIISHQQKLGMYLSGLTFIFLGCDHGTESLHWTVLSSVLSALIWLCHQEWAASHRIPDWKRPMASPPHSWAWPWITALGKTQIKPAIHVMGEHRAGKLLFKL